MTKIIDLPMVQCKHGLVCCVFKIHLREPSRQFAWGLWWKITCLGPRAYEIENLPFKSPLEKERLELVLHGLMLESFMASRRTRHNRTPEKGDNYEVWPCQGEAGKFRKGIEDKWISKLDLLLRSRMESVANQMDGIP